MGHAKVGLELIMPLALAASGRTDASGAANFLKYVLPQIPHGSGTHSAPTARALQIERSRICISFTGVNPSATLTAIKRNERLQTFVKNSATAVRS